MKELVSGLLRFQRDVFPGKKEIFENLAGEQNPKALFVTCADSRVVPDLIMQCGPGELFISRNAGNIVPPHGELRGGVSATIEYAVSALGIQDIIVCGHSDCGAMKGILHPEKVKSMPMVAAWLWQAEGARRVVEDNYPHLSEKEKLEKLTEQNVLSQIDHLRTHPSVAAGLAKGNLRLYGWVYNIKTGEMLNYDAEAGEFRLLRDADEIPTANLQTRRLLAMQR